MNPYLYPGMHDEQIIPAIEEIKTFKKQVNDDLDRMRKKIQSETRYETLENYIERVFRCDLTDKSRQNKTAFGKHIWRYILMSVDKNYQMQPVKRKQGGHQTINYKYSTLDVSIITGCGITNVHDSINTVIDLLETNRAYKEKSEMIFNKIRHGLLIFP